MSLRRAIGGLLLCIFLLAPKVVFADRRADARRYFRQGMQLINAKKPVEGVRLLQKAYDALPHPDVLYNIGQISAKQGLVVEAIRAFEAYLEFEPKDQEAVAVLIAQLKAKLPRTAGTAAAVAVAPMGAAASTVTVDLAGLTRSQNLMRALAAATDSPRLRGAIRDLESLEKVLREGVAQKPSVSVPTKPQLVPPPAVTTATAGTAAPTDAPRLDDIYDAQLYSASRYSQSSLDAPSATHIITRDEIRMTGLSNIAEILRRVPGMDVMTNSPADVNLSIRGFNQRLSNRLLVLVDGRSVYFDPLGTVFWHTLTIGVEDIERIEVIRGPASALYGANAFAGVVNIITRLPGEDTAEFVASAGSHGWLHEHASASGRSGPIGWRLSTGMDSALRFSQELSNDRVDAFRNFEDQELSWRMLRANGSFSYKASEDVALIARGGVSRGRSEWQAVSGLRAFGMDTSLNAVASAQLDTKYGLAKVFYNRLQATGGPQYVPLGNDPYLFRITSETLDTEAMYSKEFELVVDHNLQVGGSYRLKRVDWNYLDDKHLENHFALFVQDSLRISDWLRLQASFRADFHPLLESPPLSPRAAVIIRPSPDSAFRLSAGTAFRTPSFLESYIDVGANFDIPALTGTTRGFDVLGKNLDPESVFSLELSYANSASSFFDAEIVGYYSRVSDLAPVPVPKPEGTARLRQISGYDGTARPEFDPFLGVYSVGEARYTNEDTTYDVLGSELSVRIYPADGIDAYVNYALERVLASGPPGEYQYEDRTSAHKINAGLRFHSPTGLDLQADIHFASAQDWGELTLGGSTTNAIGSVSYHLPAYYLVNARAAYRMLGDQLEFSVTGFNITNNQHRQHPFGQLLGARVLGAVAVKL